VNAPLAQDSFQIPGDAEPDEGADRLRKRTRRAMGLIGLLLLAVFLLAVVLQVGGAVIGSGEVTVESSVKTISHPTGGTITAMLVRDGTHVVAGQELMRFDTNVSQVGSESAAETYEQLLARRARLEAERDGAGAIVFPKELTASKSANVPELIARETRLFNLRRTERSGTLDILTQRVRQYESEIRSFEVQIGATERQLVLIGPELEGLRKLHEKQLVTVGRINQMERTAVQLEGSKAALQASIAQSRAQISETRQQMLGVDKQMRAEAGTQLADVNAQLSEQHVRVASSADTYARSVIRAPQSGTVDKIAFSTVGSAVPPAQPILQIVPDRDQLIVEAKIRPQDVDQVAVGQGARITFSGLDRQSTPDLPGKVIFVSADLAQDQHSGVTYYRIKVQIDAEALAKSPQVVLKAGMPAEVFVQTGDRSILSYLLKPLLDQIRYAFREG
jgi:HlyD family type I secretion membrane fusion protein